LLQGQELSQRCQLLLLLLLLLDACRSKKALRRLRWHAGCHCRGQRRLQCANAQATRGASWCVGRGSRSRADSIEGCRGRGCHSGAAACGCARWCSRHCCTCPQLLLLLCHDRVASRGCLVGHHLHAVQLQQLLLLRRHALCCGRRAAGEQHGAGVQAAKHGGVHDGGQGCTAWRRWCHHRGWLQREVDARWQPCRCCCCPWEAKQARVQHLLPCVEHLLPQLMPCKEAGWQHATHAQGGKASAGGHVCSSRAACKRAGSWLSGRQHDEYACSRPVQAHQWGSMP
jgi:hypothetical protein